MTLKTGLFALFLSLGIGLAADDNFYFSYDTDDDVLKERIAVLLQENLDDDYNLRELLGVIDRIENEIEVNSSFIEDSVRRFDETEDGTGPSGATEMEELVRDFRLALRIVQAGKSISRILRNEALRLEAERTRLNGSLAGIAAEVDDMISLLDDIDEERDLLQQAVSSSLTAVSSLQEILAGYREIIENQRDLLKEARQSDGPRKPFSMALVGGPVWNTDAAGIGDADWSAGFLVTVPVLEWLRIGLGASTSFPPQESRLLLQIEITP